MGLSLGSMKLLTDACSYSGGMLALSSFRCARPASMHSHFSAPEIPPRSTIFQPDPLQIVQTSNAFMFNLYLPAAVPCFQGTPRLSYILSKEAAHAKTKHRHYRRRPRRT